ncbi:two-component sensor histidine kinase [Prauserella sp. PE36]|uniref:Two-component sensor histidine kinase n=1 Tax=Prauserella endophytica TaxID=1592324 RepID=A0ABY2S8I6_9PSEU|nr:MULTISPECIES: histidine kinase [Prauserella]RBM21029.1 two-component sensor histidine kinase [Prauserella sp. PE36]TKG72193.1 two-component sensor histidine kinase [Prauserella endophytica]
MSESRLEIWTAASLVAVSLLVAVPVVIDLFGDATATTGPAWAWWACYLGYLALLGLIFAGFARRPVIVLVPLALCAAGTVLLAARAGFTPILLVFVTACAATLASRRLTAAFLAANTGVVALAVVVAGGPFPDVALTSLVYAALQTCSVWAVWSERRERTARERLAVANTELRAATALLAESSRSRERLRIARELHDLLGHQLTALVLELEVASHHRGDAAAEHVLRARGLARELLGDVRTAVGELRSRPPRLREALAEIVADLPRPRVHLSVADDIEPDEECAVTLIRCVQEVVTNAIRHSEAENLWLRVDRAESGEITLRAEDDGRGAELLRIGNGLTGVRERVEQLGGRVSFESRPGFRVDATVPAP